MKTPTRKAMQLLRDSFTRDGKVICSAIDTCQGTLPLWGQLALAGLVEEQPRSWMGHDFSYRLTAAGENLLNTP